MGGAERESSQSSGHMPRNLQASKQGELPRAASDLHLLYQQQVRPDLTAVPS